MSAKGESTVGRSAGVLCAVLGVLLLLGGFFAYSYEQRGWYGLWVTYPYRDLAIPLIVLGVVLIIVGAFLYSYAPHQRAYTA